MYTFYRKFIIYSCTRNLSLIDTFPFVRRTERRKIVVSIRLTAEHRKLTVRSVLMLSDVYAIRSPSLVLRL